MDAPWRIELLGGLRATLGDHVVSRFRSHQTGGLLAYLAFYQHCSHPREELIERLWPECDPEAGRNRFRVALSSLRRQLEPPGVPAGAVLVADRANLRLNPAAAVIDVAQFEAALQAAARGPLDEARRLGLGHPPTHEGGSRASRPGFQSRDRLAEATELYRGELLPGYFDDWIFPERQRLAEAFLDALGQLIGLHWQAGDLAGALQYARRAVSADPLREEAHHDLIRMLVAAGQPETARRQYEELERLLRQELDAEPASEIRALISGLEPRAARRSQHGDTEIRRVTEREGTEAGDVEGAGLFVASLPGIPSSMPAGTVTFLLIEWVAAPEHEQETAELALPEAREEYYTRLCPVLLAHGGHELPRAGDLLRAAFGRAGTALAAAVAGMEHVSRIPCSVMDGKLPDTRHAIPETQYAIRNIPRMALHTGDVGPPAEGDPGRALQCALRILQAAHPGQILCSEETASLLRREPAEGVRLIDRGVYRLRGAAAPERLFQVESAGMAQQEFPLQNAEAGYAGSLPLQFTRFFGREAEIAQLVEPLSHSHPSSLNPHPSRLVTLTGPGGSGKTRLALEAAARLRKPFLGVVWFVPLADLADARLILDKMMEMLRLPRSPHVEPLEQVVEMLSRQPSLLVLDSFEHLVREGAALMQVLLERIPALTCLVTSRQRLGLAGEREFPVAPLPVPGVRSSVFGLRFDPNTEHRTPNTEALNALSQCPSVQLFLDRAQAVRPDFQVTPGNAAAIAALCARLEGLPLALELAAARARMLTPAQMLARLEQRFELLTSRHREADPRHRSLWAAVDWSYQLLSPELQRVFARLSVFRGGWSLEAAEAVCGEREVLECLEQLQECSLLLAEQGSGVRGQGSVPTPELTPDPRPPTPDDEMRYRLLESLREYALEQLAPEERLSLARQHAAYYRALAERAEPELLGPDQAAWLERLERERDNLRAALDWCAETVDGGQWLVDSPKESASKTDVLSSEPTTTHYPPTTAAETGLCLAGSLWAFWWVRGYLSEGRERLARLMVPGVSKARAKAQACAGLLAHFQGDHAAAHRCYEESLSIGRELGDRWVVAVSLTGLGFLAQYQVADPAARSYFEESLPIWRSLDDRWGMALALEGLGGAAIDQDDPVAARALYEESLAMQRERNDQWGIALSLRNLGKVARHERDMDAARSCYEESLLIRSRLADRRGVAECLEGLAGVAVGQHEPARAARLLGAAQALRAAIGAPLPPAARCDYERQVADARAGLDAAGFAAAWEAGATLTWEAAVAEALGGPGKSTS